MAEKVRIGIISTSWWAEMMLLPTLKSHTSADVVAVCGRNRERASEIAKNYDVPNVFSDYKEMIDKGELQAVVVAPPDDLHYPMTMYALDAHIFGEKPLAMNAKQAREMYEKAESVGVKHMTHFTWRWLPIYQYVRKLIDDGYIGKFFQCYMNFLSGLERDPNYRWRFDKKRSNGAICDYGAHMFDLARMLYGDVAKVSANLCCFIDRKDIDGQPCEAGNDSAIVAIQFENGAQGLIQLSEVVHMGDRVATQKVILLGDSGTLEVDHSFARVFDPNAIHGSEIRGTRNGENKFETLSVPDEFYGEAGRESLLAPYFQQSIGVRHFIDSIINDKPATTSFYDGWKVQQVIDAAIESHNNNRWIGINEFS